MSDDNIFDLHPRAERLLSDANQHHLLSDDLKQRPLIVSDDAEIIESDNDSRCADAGEDLCLRICDAIDEVERTFNARINDLRVMNLALWIGFIVLFIMYTIRIMISYSS